MLTSICCVFHQFAFLTHQLAFFLGGQFLSGVLFFEGFQSAAFVCCPSICFVNEVPSLALLRKWLVVQWVPINLHVGAELASIRRCQIARLLQRHALNNSTKPQPS